MRFQNVLVIPCGYQVITKEQTGKISRITELLLSGKQFEYEKAINYFDGTATLIYSVKKCPYCGGEVAANRREEPILSKEKVLRWSAGQTGMFEKEKDTLIINPELVFSGKMRCPNCGKESKKAEDYEEIMLLLENNKIKISRKINDFSEPFRLSWVKKAIKSVPMVGYETLVFHLKRGRSYLQLEDGKGSSICTRDITEMPEWFEEDPLCQMIMERQMLRKEIKKLFQKVASFPFSAKEITLEKLVLATRFLGYKKPFYSTIPFLIGTRKLEPGLRTIAKKMQRAMDVPDWYQKENLPPNKSTRRILFSDPGLLFFYQEIKWLYRVVDNIDYLNRILMFANRYTVLSKLYTFPVLKEFFFDAFRYEKKQVVMDCLEKKFFGLVNYGRLYVTLRESLKRAEHNKKNWLKESIKDLEHEKLSTVEQNPMIEDCEVEGYQFVWLVNTNDFYDAGKAMDNCLRHSIYLPVVVVKKEEKYCAAIALDSQKCRKVIEVRLTRNRPVMRWHPVYKAIEKWCEKQQIEWEKNEYYTENT